jgi:hypothetical protein
VIPNDALINFVRTELDYHYKGQADRVVIYKQRGSTKRLMIRRNAMHDETAVRVLLKQAGADPAKIERFVAQYKANQK